MTYKTVPINVLIPTGGYCNACRFLDTTMVSGVAGRFYWLDCRLSDGPGRFEEKPPVDNIEKFPNCPGGTE